jgi:hypothetical protein
MHSITHEYRCDRPRGPTTDTQCTACKKNQVNLIACLARTFLRSTLDILKHTKHMLSCLTNQKHNSHSLTVAVHTAYSHRPSMISLLYYFQRPPPLAVPLALTGAGSPIFPPTPPRALTNAAAGDEVPPVDLKVPFCLLVAKDDGWSLMRALAATPATLAVSGRDASTRGL